MTQDERIEFIQWRNAHQFELAFEYSGFGGGEDLIGFRDFCERKWLALRQEAFAE